MLKVALPRPSSDAVIRGDGRAYLHPSVDEDDDKPPRRWSRAEVEALRQAEPVLSPWSVIATQVVLGLVAAGVVWLLADATAAVSALYGAAVVALPGALMARGATSRISSLSPVISAASMLWWGFVKMGAAIAMLILAPRIVEGLVWPAMLVTMVVCMQTYWFALLWRGRKST